VTRSAGGERSRTCRLGHSTPPGGVRHVTLPT
jgi:hypothetical protein